MKSRLRYICDSNIIISALLFDHSKPGQALLTVMEQGELLLSFEIVAELSDVIRREKFDRYVQRKTREEFLKSLIENALIVDIVEHIQECRDPQDDKFLDLAINGGASCIVSGDDDLLVMNTFRGIPILTAEQFLKWIEEKRDE